MHSVVFELKPSRALSLLIVVLHAISMIVLLIVPLAIFLKIVGLGLLLYSGIQRWLHIVRRDSQSVVRIWQYANGQWALELQNSRFYKANLKGDTFQHPWLMILSLQTPQHCFYIPIPRDALSDFEFRTLSTRLSFF